MSEETAPYGSGSGTPAPRAPVKRVRTQHLREMKERGERFAMLTAYDMYTAQIFDDAGIEVLLVGDSASNNVYGNETSLPVTVDGEGETGSPTGKATDPRLGIILGVIAAVLALILPLVFAFEIDAVLGPIARINPR